MAAPKSWVEASQRARAKWNRARDRLSDAMRQPDEQKRSDAYKQSLIDVRSIAEPYISLLDATGRKSDKRAFHEWIASQVPSWEAIKTLRELDYHDGHLPGGHGAFMNTPVTLTAGPGEAVQMQAVPGTGRMEQRRFRPDGTVEVTEGPPIHSFETLGAGGWFGRHGLGLPEWGDSSEPCLEMPRELAAALVRWDGLIDVLARGWVSA